MATAGPLTWDAERDGFTLLPYEVVNEIQWRSRPTLDRIEVWLPAKRTWRRLRTYWIPILEGYRDGLSLPRIHERLKETHPELSSAVRRTVVRRSLSTMRRGGLLKVQQPPPPASFADRYDVLEQLGTGGMGVVWRCYDTHQGNEVAVKHAWNLSGSFRSRERSIRAEGAVMRRLDHPNVATFLDDVEVDGRYHLVRELATGRRLSTHARIEGLTAAQRAGLHRQLAMVLDHMLDQGLVYLDIKPTNFFVSPDGNHLLLTDLGTCKELEPGERSITSTAGTRRYMAPEVRAHGTVTEPALAYSLGRTYFQVLVGRKPRFKLTRDDAMDRIRTAGASPQEAALLHDLLAEDPAQRPATLRDVAARLAEVGRA